MKNLQYIALGAFLSFALAALAAQPIYNQFAPGGDLAGEGSTWNNQVIADGAIDLAGGKTTGINPVSKGGTGVGTLTGIVKGNGTLAFGAAGLSDILALRSGCDGSTFLRGDGQCVEVEAGEGGGGGEVSFADPTAQIGPTAVNGSAETAMRSDAAPAINLGASYSWTGTHSFSTMPTIPNNGVTLAKIESVSSARILGRTSSGSGNVESLTGTQATALLSPFSSSAQGVVPATGGGSDKYLRSDGTWVTLPTIASGSYTPSLISTPTVATVSFDPWQYQQIGDIVYASGFIRVDANSEAMEANGLVSFSFTLPVGTSTGAFRGHLTCSTGSYGVGPPMAYGATGSTQGTAPYNRMGFLTAFTAETGNPQGFSCQMMYKLD